MGKMVGRIPHTTQRTKDPEMSSTISMGYNTMGTSTYTKEPRITEYEPNISEIATVPKTTITQYGADIPKEVLDNIPTFDGKPQNHTPRTTRRR